MSRSSSAAMMNMENPYSAPQTPLSIADSAQPDFNAPEGHFPELETPALKKLFRDSQSIYAVGHTLWILFVLAAALAIPVAMTQSSRSGEEFSVGWIPCFVAAVTLLVAYGILARTPWGRIAGVLVCGAGIFGFIALTALLILKRVNQWNHPAELILIATGFVALLCGLLSAWGGLTAFAYRPELFGETRYTHAALKQELAVRNCRPA